MRGLALNSPESDYGLHSEVGISDDLDRNVYCVFGLPIDDIDIAGAVEKIELAAASRSPFIISTPNLNFLVNGRKNDEFRESVLLSDLCTADGMPIIWIARLLGLPITRRTAGSDLFEALKGRQSSRPIRVFLFGAKETVAAAAAKKLNMSATGLRCVGWACPGWGSVDELSQQSFVDTINASDADFLVASLGAVKGQLWLQRNHGELRVPIRAHLGATINFQAGTVSRAPNIMRRSGLEWLWRIKEEPRLWRRYCHDGAIFFLVTLPRVLLLAVYVRSLRRRRQDSHRDFTIRRVDSSDTVTLFLNGYAIDRHVNVAVACFRAAASSKKRLTVDFSETRAIDSRFLGLLLMMRKQHKARGTVPRYVGVTKRLRWIFRLNGIGYLLH
jgi:N-acetylglucosaminyldiphosphoundecaprenol N-acetyl-beta-D-mannosaminyltransferase